MTLPNQDEPKVEATDQVSSQLPRLKTASPVAGGRFYFGDYDKPIKLFLLGLVVVAVLSVIIVGMQHLVFWQFALLSILPIVLYLFAVMIVVMMWEPPRRNSGPGKPADKRGE